MSERIDLRNGWFITKIEMSDRFRIHHPEHGEIFHIDAKKCEPEMREFIAAITPSDVRAAALEEAAKIADSLPGWQQPRDVATAIRALIGQPQGDAGTGGAAPISEEQG